MHVLSFSVAILPNKLNFSVDAEAFEDFSEAFDSSGSNQLFCWHSREKLEKYISISVWLRVDDYIYRP